MVNSDNTSRRLLVISIWDRMWALDGEAGVSDDHHFIAGFNAAGWDVHFLAPAGAQGRAAFPGVTLHTYPNFFARTAALPTGIKRLLWLPLFRLIVGPRALRLARKLRPHFILGHSHYTAPVARHCRKRLGIPAGVKLFGVMDLVHTHWPRARYIFKNFEQLIALRYPQDVWIVLDDGTRGDEMLQRTGIPADRIRFLPNGLDLEWQSFPFDRADARASIGVGDGAEAVLFLARLVPSKRPADVVRAAVRVIARRPGAVFLFAGDGPERDACERLAKEAGLEDRIRFLGSVAHERIPRLMAAADQFVTTSSLTNMALPTCEALICGVPVVAYDTGGTERVVREGETGRLVPDGDVEALADTLHELLGQPQVREHMSRRAISLSRELFTSWSDRIDMELDIIGALAARTPTDPQ